MIPLSILLLLSIWSFIRAFISDPGYVHYIRDPLYNSSIPVTPKTKY